jgi:ATP-dependent protease ClpP protease subunit
VNRNTPWRTTRGTRLLALSQGQNDWYKIKAQTDAPSLVHIYDEIGFFGVSASDFISDLLATPGALDVHLNSPGGEVNDGLAIYNCLMARDGVTIYVDGMAASIASVVAMAGDKILIAPTAQMMVHNAFTMAVGDASDLRETADRLDENTRNIAGIYEARTGKPAAEWLEIMKVTGWYRGQEAVDAGLADGLIELKSKASVPAAKNFDMSVYGRRAAPVAAGATNTKNAAQHPYHDDTETMHGPRTGVHSHNHAAFGHSDHEDGIHHHSHYHNGDATHEHPHMSHEHPHEGHGHPHSHAHDEGQSSYGVDHGHSHTHHVWDPDHDGDDDSRPDDGRGGGDTDHDYFATMREHVFSKAALETHIMDASYDDSSWDAGPAMKAASASNNPAAAFRAICAGRRDGPAEERGSWALPHHKHPGSPPNKHGVSAALGRLDSTEGLTNKSAARSHLEAHQKAWASSEASASAGPEYTDEDVTLLINSLKG